MASCIVNHHSSFIDILSFNGKTQSYSTIYLLLRGSTLFWFKRRSDNSHSGSIFLRDCNIKETGIIGGFKIISPSSMSYTFKASNNTQRDDWIKTLISTAELAKKNSTIKRNRSISTPINVSDAKRYRKSIKEVSNHHDIKKKSPRSSSRVKLPKSRAKILSPR